MFRRILRAIRDFDWMLFAVMVSLILIGLAAIGSVSFAQGVGNFTNFWKQAIIAGVGVVLVIFVGASNYRAFESLARILYVVGGLLLVSVLIFGTTIRGTTGWFVFGNFNLQPVEFAKIILVIFLARYFSHHAYARDLRSLVGSGVGAMLFVVLTLMQPDFGSAMVLILLWGTMLLFSGTKRRYVAMLFGIAIASAVFAWLFVLQPFQQERILTFVDPNRDPLGRGYNLTQSVIAVGAGELFGRGLGFGSQSQLRFLPESQTDFVFAVVAEELGFLAVLVVLALYALLIYRAIRLARQATDNFTLYMTSGIALIFAIQVIINIGMNIGLMPITGITLPFLSYGGSSLLSSMLLVGILQSVAVRLRSVNLRTVDVDERGW